MPELNAYGEPFMTALTELLAQSTRTSHVTLLGKSGKQDHIRRTWEGTRIEEEIIFNWC